MYRFVLCVSVAVVLSGCGATMNGAGPKPDISGPETGVDTGMRPAPRPSSLDTSGAGATAPKPPTAARTAEDFDTTTAAQRAEAAGDAPTTGGSASDAAAERQLGKTVGSLGDPTKPGFWIKTPLVNKEQDGRVVYPATGESVLVQLIPLEGPKTAGSQVSLATLRLLSAPLTGLPELIIYAK